MLLGAFHGTTPCSSVCGIRQGSGLRLIEGAYVVGQRAGPAGGVEEEVLIFACPKPRTSYSQ